MILQSDIGYDSQGKPYQCYLFQLSNGDYLQIDKVLADIAGAKTFCQIEVDNAEMAIKDGVWA